MTISRQPLAVLPDTPDTRLLTELTSHASDLSEASHALACALGAGEGSELWIPLTSHAVTAYIRPFILSNVRRRLDEMPEIPPMAPPDRSWMGWNAVRISPSLTVLRMCSRTRCSTWVSVTWEGSRRLVPSNRRPVPSNAGYDLPDISMRTGLPSRCLQQTVTAVQP
ncbi:hypothetical protein QF038_004179 [Pseudarthrobacter sp. W1I19]|nr:hypothetical protein [Pseudarthrobacter sp. W1I19]